METDLFDFAYIPDWYGQLEELEGINTDRVKGRPTGVAIGHHPVADIAGAVANRIDRKSTRLNSSHQD